MCLSQANDEYPAVIHITRVAHVQNLAIKFFLSSPNPLFVLCKVLLYIQPQLVLR